MVGTDVSLDGCKDADIEKAKNLFLCFSHEKTLDDTGFGSVLETPEKSNAGIFIHGVKVAEESNFLFSYNITDLPNKLRKALNRERDNVGRAAYTDAVKNIIKSVENEEVLEAYMKDLGEVVKGGGHDEMNWIDVQLYVIEQLSRKNDKLLFITGDEAVKRRSEVSDTQDESYQVFIIPDKLKEKAKSIRTVMTLEKYNQSKNNAFSGDALNISDLTPAEQEVYNMMPEILAFMNGLPGVIASVKISESTSHPALELIPLFRLGIFHIRTIPPHNYKNAKNTERRTAMAKEIKCDICGSPMQSRIENCKLTYKGQDYHTDALVYYCTCGYKKLGTCDVHIWFDDEPEKQSQISDTKTPRIRKIEKPIDAPKESETESEKESIQESLTQELIKETEQEPRLFYPKEDREQDVLRRKMPWPFGHGKYTASDEWLDYMLEKHPWFEKFYMRFISFDHRQDRYLSQHKPNYRAIHHNILYDTAKAELFYDETIKDGKSLIKRYYYVTGNDKYFCIRIKYGEKDDMDVKSVDEIKRLLEKQPEIYTKVIHEKVENMEDEHPAKEDEKENTPQETTENTEESKPDPTNGRRPII